MYILKGKRVIPCENTLEWGKWMQKKTRVLKKEKVGDQLVSTVFLGLDYRLGMKDDGHPLIFETMVFPDCEIMDRYYTYDEALEGHKRIADELKSKQ